MEVKGIRITRNTSKPVQTTVNNVFIFHFFVGGGVGEGGVKTEMDEKHPSRIA